MEAIIYASLGTGFTFLVTALGAALVLFFRKTVNDTAQRVLLGFASGVMIAASVWSLILPAFEEAENTGGGLLPVAGGVILGAVFLWFLDEMLDRRYRKIYSDEGEAAGIRHRRAMLFTAVTLHNIPEGMAVGLSFALAAQHGMDSAGIAAASALALGIGIQNFPEGAAISLPLRQDGFSRARSFFWGAMSGIVEPLFGILVVLAAGTVQPLMPWLLAFAAGAMLYVVAEELIPQSHGGKYQWMGALSFMAGFLLMMVLDVALG